MGTMANHPSPAGRRITVVGLGYVGMAMAALLARSADVIALDIDPERVAKVNAGTSPVIDPDISAALAGGELRLTATTNPRAAYADPDFVVVATPTDYDTGKRFFDTSTVEEVVAQVAGAAPGTAVVIKSTVPVGFTARLQEEYPDLPILFSPRSEERRVGQAGRCRVAP